MSAARKLPSTDALLPGAYVRTGPRSLGPDASAAISPARELQASLLAGLAADHNDTEGRRWPGVVRLALIGGGSCALWGALITGGFRLLSHS